MILGKRDVETVEREKLGGAGALSKKAEVGRRESISWEGRGERERKALECHLSQPH